MIMKFKRLSAAAKVPVRATSMSAGYDLCAANEEAIHIQPGEIRMIPTGLAAAPERSDIALLIFPRSGIASKTGVTLANSVGIVDADYRGEIKVPLINHGSEIFSVETGMRIAQIVAVPVLSQEWTETDTLDETDRGEGGFGSSGVSE